MMFNQFQSGAILGGGGSLPTFGSGGPTGEFMPSPPHNYQQFQSTTGIDFCIFARNNFKM
jgi:hypothetical protein